MPRTGTLKELVRLDPLQAVIVSPSDTTYGLHSRSLSRLQTLKNRQGNFIYLVDSAEMAAKIAAVSGEVKNILERYWPGPITFVLPSKIHSKETVAVRYPKDAFCMEMIAAFKGPVLSTSCNLPQGKTVETVTEAMALFDERVDLYIDGGKRTGFKPSTLVDLTVSPHKILRQGELNYRQEPNS